MKDKFIFFCFPGIGIIEQWLPVLSELKKKGAKIDILFFEASHLYQFEKKNYVHQEIFKIFDNCYLNNNSNVIKIKSIKNLDNRLFFNKILLSMKSLITKSHKFEIFIKSYNKILYDTYFDLKDKYHYSRIINKIKKYSIHHGVALFQKNKKLFKKNFWRVNNTIFYKQNREDIENLIIFNYTNDEILFWKFIYSNKNISNYRIPILKNNKSWVNKIKLKTIDDLPYNLKNYFFLISRPASKNYLTYKTKIKIFTELANECKIRKKILVIKLHPKENKKFWSDIYKKILKQNDIDFYFSENHPYTLANKSLISFSYFSELTVSLSNQKIPVIEYLPLSNLKDPMNTCLRDIKNQKVFDYRYANLVHGVSNNKELKTKIDFIIKNRDLAVKFTYDKYKKLFMNNYSDIKKVIKLISR